MEPRKKLIVPRKRSAASINQARRNKATAYANEAPTIKNLYNAFVNWFNGTKLLGGASDYITGNAPVGGKKLQLLSPQQIKTLMPRDAAVYKRAVDKITRQDAERQLLKEAYNNRYNQENAMRDFQDEYEYIDDPYGFDPEMEWLEYKYGGTDSYPYMYNMVARRRGLPLMDETGLNY